MTRTSLRSKWQTTRLLQPPPNSSRSCRRRLYCIQSPNWRKPEKLKIRKIMYFNLTKMYHLSFYILWRMQVIANGTITPLSFFSDKMIKLYLSADKSTILCAPSRGGARPVDWRRCLTNHQASLYRDRTITCRSEEGDRRVCPQPYTVRHHGCVLASDRGMYDISFCSYAYTRLLRILVMVYTV